MMLSFHSFPGLKVRPSICCAYMGQE